MTLLNRGEEVELDVDPAVVVVLVLSDLSSNESDSHLGLRSNNRARRKAITGTPPERATHINAVNPFYIPCITLCG